MSTPTTAPQCATTQMAITAPASHPAAIDNLSAMQRYILERVYEHHQRFVGHPHQRSIQGWGMPWSTKGTAA